MEEGKIESSHQGEVVDPSYKEEEGPGTFNNDGIEKYGFQKHIDIPYGKLGEGILDDPSVPEAYGPPEKEVEEDREGHNPQSTHLNENHNDSLAEMRIEAPRIYDY